MTIWSVERTSPLMTPKPAAKPVGNSTVRSIPRNSEISFSRLAETRVLPMKAGEPALCTP